MEPQEQHEYEDGEFNEANGEVGEDFADMPFAKDVGKGGIQQAEKACDPQAERNDGRCQVILRSYKDKH